MTQQLQLLVARYCIKQDMFCEQEQTGEPTAGHKLHHDVSAAAVRPDERQTAGSGPNTER